MNQDANKRRAAEAALDHIEDGSVIGVGTGSTVALFVEVLARVRQRIEGAVASSQATEALLRVHRIPVVDLNSAGDLPLYIDGADEATRFLHLIKGGGGALTREKIIATASRLFVCIIDHSKLVDVLGRFPLPVEVIPMARSFVARQLVKLGGQPQWRRGLRHRQRQRDPRCPSHEDPGPRAPGGRDRPDPRGGVQRGVRAPPGRSLARRFGARCRDDALRGCEKTVASEGRSRSAGAQDRFARSETERKPAGASPTDGTSNRSVC